MPSAADRLEARLAAESRRSACVLTGTATTAIYAALCVVRERSGPGEVIVPAITCASVAQAVQYAGLRPVYADVTLPEGTVDPAAVRALVGSRTRAILAIHIYGNPAPLDELAALAEPHGIALIEDAAQATGGSLDGRSFGNFGAFSVVSFGGTKIVMAGGGGALLTDDGAAAARARELLAALPPSPGDAALDLLALSQRNLTMGLIDLLRVAPETPAGGAFREHVDDYRALWLQRLARDSPVVERIAAGLDGLDANLAHRRSVARRYHAALAGRAGVVRCSGWERSGVVWRYTFLAPDPERTIRLTAALRGAGLDASNHYWSVAQLLAGERLPAATELGRRVVNLWVDGTASDAYVERAIAVLRRELA